MCVKYVCKNPECENVYEDEEVFSLTELEGLQCPMCHEYELGIVVS